MRPGAPGAPRGNQRGQAQPSAATVAAMSGAVDLGALKARNDAAARAKEAPPPAAGQFVVDVSEASLQGDVIDRSFQVPVLLALTSARVPNIDQFVADLTAAVNGRNGAMVLAKVDFDANPRIGQSLQVRGLPAVFAVIGGQVVPGFEGVLPTEQIAEFLDAVVDAGTKAGVTGGGAPPAQDGDQPAAEQPAEDARFTAAEDALDAGDYDLATQRYQAILDQEPANQEAQLALGQVRLLQRLESIDQAAAARADTSPDDVDAQLAAADLALAGNDVPGAFARLLDTVRRTAGDERDRVRQRLLEIFELLGPDDPRVPPARRELTRALF